MVSSALEKEIDALAVKSVEQVKSEGVFDMFRRDCLQTADNSRKFKVLKRRVETFTRRFLESYYANPTANTNQNAVREALRNELNREHFIKDGIDGLVADMLGYEQREYRFLPEIEKVVAQHVPDDEPEPEPEPAPVPYLSRRDMQSELLAMAAAAMNLNPTHGPGHIPGHYAMPRYETKRPDFSQDLSVIRQEMEKERESADDDGSRPGPSGLGSLDDIPLPPSAGQGEFPQVYGLDSDPGTPVQDENVIIEDELSISKHVTALSPNPLEERAGFVYSPIDMDIDAEEEGEGPSIRQFIEFLDPADVRIVDDADFNEEDFDFDVLVEKKQD